MSAGSQVAVLIDALLEAAFEEHEHLITEEDFTEFVGAVVQQVVVTQGIRSLSADYVANEARAYARDYQRDMDGGV